MGKRQWMELVLDDMWRYILMNKKKLYRSQLISFYKCQLNIWFWDVLYFQFRCVSRLLQIPKLFWPRYCRSLQRKMSEEQLIWCFHVIVRYFAKSSIAYVKILWNLKKRISSSSCSWDISLSLIFLITNWCFIFIHWFSLYTIC